MMVIMLVEVMKPITFYMLLSTQSLSYGHSTYYNKVILQLNDRLFSYNINCYIDNIIFNGNWQSSI